MAAQWHNRRLPDSHSGQDPKEVLFQGPQDPLPRIGETQGDIPIGRPQGPRRVSFGSVFDASSGQNGGGQENQEPQDYDDWNEPQEERRTVAPANHSLFNLEIKPKDPPIFYGRASEDVSTWISKVSDFFYLTGATERQQVANAATLLQEAAADWWVTLLRENYGERPADFQEFAVRLEKRFGSSTRVDRARAALRDIRQGQSEDVRAFSTRFEGLLGKLPSWDQDWAKTQFIWGLHTRSRGIGHHIQSSRFGASHSEGGRGGNGQKFGSRRSNTAKEHKPVPWPRKIPKGQGQIQRSTE